MTYQVLFLHMDCWLHSFLSGTGRYLCVILLLLLGWCSFPASVHGMTRFQEIKSCFCASNKARSRLHKGALRQSLDTLLHMKYLVFQNYTVNRTAVWISNATTVLILSYTMELQEPSCGWFSSVKSQFMKVKAIIMMVSHCCLKLDSIGFFFPQPQTH